MQIARTRRLVLSRLTLDDAPFVLALVNDPDWLHFIGDKGVRTPDDARAYLRDGPLAMYAQHGFGLWRVDLTATGAPVGLCGLLQRDGLDDVDLGFAFLASARGLGLALEAAQATVAHGFEALGLPRIVAITLPHNQRSRHLLERLGMRLERHVRLPVDGPEKLLYGINRPQ